MARIFQDPSRRWFATVHEIFKHALFREIMMLSLKRLLMILMTAGFLLMIGCESDDEIEDIEEEVEESSLRHQQMGAVGRTA